MLLLCVILLIIFIPEALLCFSQVRVLGLKKRITLTVHHKDSSYKKTIDIKQTDTSKKYQIGPKSESFLQVKDKKVFICFPYPEPLIQGFLSKKYSIGNGISVSMKKKKPTFLFSVITCIFMIITIFIFKCFAKSMILSFVNSSKQVVLTYNFADNIDSSKWNGITNYLIVGSDAREGLSSSRTDVIILISFNENNKKVKICSLSRDLRVAINDKTIITIDQLDSSLPNYDALKKVHLSHNSFKQSLTMLLISHIYLMKANRMMIHTLVVLTH